MQRRVLLLKKKKVLLSQILTAMKVMSVHFGPIHRSSRIHQFQSPTTNDSVLYKKQTEFRFKTRFLPHSRRYPYVPNSAINGFEWRQSTAYNLLILPFIETPKALSAIEGLSRRRGRSAFSTESRHPSRFCQRGNRRRAENRAKTARLATVHSVVRYSRRQRCATHERDLRRTHTHTPPPLTPNNSDKRRHFPLPSTSLLPKNDSFTSSLLPRKESSAPFTLAQKTKREANAKVFALTHQRN